MIGLRQRSSRGGTPKYKISVIVAACLFCGGIGAAFLIPIEATGPLSGELDALEQIVQMLKPFKVSTCVFIFFKNVSVLLLGFLLSPLLCLVPILTLLLNGWLLSSVSIPLIQEGSIVLLLAAILPHGILEIPAFIMGEAAALSFGLAVMPRIIRWRWSNFGETFKQNGKYLLIAILMLIPAAIIETYLTPTLIARCL